MVQFSRYAHTFDLGSDVAIYHSLRMKPVYLNKKIYEDLRAWLASPFCNDYDDAPDNIKKEVNELVKFKILNHSAADDDKVIQFVRSRIPKPAVNVCYMITSEQCNLACKYCFLGNNDKHKRNSFSLENMSIETADKAIDFFIKQIKLSGMAFEGNKPIIIFYGGEPLMNYDVLIHIAEKVNKLRDVEPCIKNLEMSMVTNGLLLTEKRAIKLKELGVSIAISVDGFTEKANSMRIDVAGNNVFNKILKTLDMCKRVGINVALSVTLSEETIKNTKDILSLIDHYGINSFGFNIMMSDENFIVPQEYNEKAARYIIDMFIELRKRGIYEDRIMRKLKAFSKSQVYFSDCAATAGGQIVVAPSGQVGICHGCLHNKQYFVTNVDDAEFNAVKHQDFIEWSQLTPINKEECQDCAALGICGGGCPINAMHLKKGNTIHDIDKRFCTHAKLTLDFLIRDLYRIIKEG